MDIFKLFQSCSHQEGRLQRRPVPKKEFKLGLPGVGTMLSVNNSRHQFVYYCPTCKSDLPASENSRWEVMYNTSVSKATPSALKTGSADSKSKPVYKREPIGAKLRYDILTRDNHRCVKCGASGKDTPLHVDHKRPVAHGGTNDPSNLQTLCQSCNLGKGARKG